jgi:hypothetical protein
MDDELVMMEEAPTNHNHDGGLDADDDNMLLNHMLRQGALHSHPLPTPPTPLSDSTWTASIQIMSRPVPAIGERPFVDGDVYKFELRNAGEQFGRKYCGYPFCEYLCFHPGLYPANNPDGVISYVIDAARLGGMYLQTRSSPRSADGIITAATFGCNRWRQEGCKFRFTLHFNRDPDVNCCYIRFGHKYSNCSIHTCKKPKLPVVPEELRRRLLQQLPPQPQPPHQDIHENAGEHPAEAIIIQQQQAAQQYASLLLRELTDEEQAIVHQAMYGAGPGTEVIAGDDIDTVQRSNMQTLQPGQWLNDEIIHYFLQLLAKRDEDSCRRIPCISETADQVV